MWIWHLIVRLSLSIMPSLNFSNRPFLKDKWWNDMLQSTVFVLWRTVLWSIGIPCLRATINFAITPKALKESFFLTYNRARCFIMSSLIDICRNTMSVLYALFPSESTVSEVAEVWGLEIYIWLLAVNCIARWQILSPASEGRFTSSFLYT